MAEEENTDEVDLGEKLEKLVDRSRHGMLEVLVIDNGIGIMEEDIDKE